MIGWLDIAALSKYCCTSPRTIEMWIKERGLRYSRVRGKRLVKREWLDEFLEAHEADHGNNVDRIVSDICKEMEI
jgi:excisionase family DNA binding protein